MQISLPYKYVLLMGDFNARTATLNDITIPDNNIFDFTAVESTSIFDADPIAEIQKNVNFTVTRSSQDKSTNKMGRVNFLLFIV